MKRLALVLILSLVVSGLAFCASADAKVFPLGSEIYDLYDALFVSAGQVVPSTSRPWTAAEARNELQKLDVNSLRTEDQKRVYETVSDLISEPESPESFGAGITISPEAYFHTNENYATDDMWNYGFEDRSAFAKMYLEASIEGFYTYCELAYGWGRTTNKDQDKTLSEIASANGKTWAGLGAVVGPSDGGLKVVTKSDVYSRKALFNFPAITQIEIDVPRQTFFTFATDHVSFGYYKAQKQWGITKLGNFIYDDHISAYNTITLKVFGQKFAFDYSFMIPSQSYANNQTAEKPAEFRRIFASHRLDWYVLKNLTITASENVMYRFDTPDLDILNPGSIYHNNTNSTLLNAIAHLEVQYAPFDGFMLYVQFCLDQATAPTESNDQDPAWGIGAGLRYASLDKGLFTVTVEGLATSAALYRRNNVDFIIHTNNSTNAPYTRYPIFTYIGFEYGGGCIAACINASYDNLDGLEMYAGASFFARGQFDMFDSHSSTGDNKKVPNRRLGILNGNVELSYILNIGSEYEMEVARMPLCAFVDLSYLYGVRSYSGSQGGDFQVSLGISLDAQTRQT